MLNAQKALWWMGKRRKQVCDERETAVLFIFRSTLILWNKECVSHSLTLCLTSYRSYPIILLRLSEVSDDA